MAGVILDQIHDKKVLSTSGEIYLNRYYSMLNDTGKQLAVDYVEGLTENPKYTLKADNDEVQIIMIYRRQKIIYIQH